MKMEFVSEILDIDKEAFISLEELKVIGADIAQLMLKYKNCNLFGYRFIFMGVMIWDTTEVPLHESNFMDVTDISNDKMISFIQDYIRDSSGMFYDEAYEFWKGKIRCNRGRWSETGLAYGFKFYHYSLEEYKERLKLGEDVFAIPARISRDNAVQDHDLYFKKSDIDEFMPGAREARKAGTSKAQLEAKDRSMQAAILVTQWITESGFQPGNVTKAMVQNFLGENTFGFGDSELFRDVWKAIPYTMKSSGGRPPGK